eukprot:GHRR01034486.1.p1 GENE.GHRR01034486.1~~GHRR01034486.1.p1  ORF type:complete len:649 (+),score=169.85 GHRR01034486.1:621-2567(+)
MHQNGELSVTNNVAEVASSLVPLTVAQAAAVRAMPPHFQVRPVIGALSTQWTGVGGGTVLNITLDPGSAAFDVNNPDANQVLVGGIPCTLDPEKLRAGSLSTVTPPITGRIAYEAWQLSVDNWALPDFNSIGPAHARRVELVNASTGLHWAWGDKGPLGLPSTVTDHWAVRLSFYLRVPAGGNTTLWLNVDDQACITVFDLGGSLLVNQTYSWTNSRLTLPAMPAEGGQVRVIVSLVENGGSAVFKLTWDGPAPGNTSRAQTPILPQSVSILPSGVPLPLTVLVNGVTAGINCTSMPDSEADSNSALIVSTNITAGITAYGEFSNTIPVSLCEHFVFSALLGPSVTGAITPNKVNATDTVLSVPLIVPNGTSAADLVVNIGGKSCGGLQLYHLPGVNGATASDTGDAVDGALEKGGPMVLKCIAPNLPSGVYTFQLLHNTWGAAGIEPAVPNITITYCPSISSVGPNTPISTYGGIALNITGFGFAPMVTGIVNTVNTSSADGTTSFNASSDSNSSLSVGLSAPSLEQYAVAATPLPSCAPGVVGVPLIPWDLTKPASVQHLAPHNPPTVAHVASAGLVIAETSVQVKGTALPLRCMVTEATETWVACRLQRSSLKLFNTTNNLQVSVLGLNNVTQKVEAIPAQLSYL